MTVNSITNNFSCFAMLGSSRVETPELSSYIDVLWGLLHPNAGSNILGTGTDLSQDTTQTKTVFAMLDALLQNPAFSSDLVTSAKTGDALGQEDSELWMSLFGSVPGGQSLADQIHAAVASGDFSKLEGEMGDSHSALYQAYHDLMDSNRYTRSNTTTQFSGSAADYDAFNKLSAELSDISDLPFDLTNAKALLSGFENISASGKNSAYFILLNSVLNLKFGQTETLAQAITNGDAKIVNQMINNGGFGTMIASLKNYCSANLTPPSN